MAQHNRFGNEAEEKALDYLLQKGYTLLEKNYRYGHAEEGKVNMCGGKSKKYRFLWYSPKLYLF